MAGTPGCAKGLLLTLCSELTSGCVQGTVCGVRDQTWVGSVKGKHPTFFSITLAQKLISFLQSSIKERYIIYGFIVDLPEKIVFYLSPKI